MATSPPKAGVGLPEERRYERTIQYVADAVWAIHPSALAVICEIVSERRAGYRPTAEEIRERIGIPPDTGDLEQEATASPVAVIDLSGPIFPKANLMTEVSGASSIDTFRASFREAIASPDVTAILLNIDSPGGSTGQIPEMAAEILASRGQKPIVAQANGWAASAAYWLAAAADEIVITPSGEVGSIGVYTVHDDISAAQEKLGVKTTLVSAGKYKTEGNPFEPLSDEARADMQQGVDAMYEMFVASVAKGRGVTAKTVLADFGQGRMLQPTKAVEVGMADRVATFDQTLARLEKVGGASRKTRTGGDVTERRTVPIEGIEWRDSSASGEPKMIVRGHAVVFDRLSLNLGGFKEKFAAGSLDDVLDSNPDVHLDWDHLGSLALARTRSNQYQLELRPDPQGLHFYATVAPTSYAKDLRLLMESGVIDQASVVFTTPEDGSGEKWELDKNGDVIRTITKVDGIYGICIAAQGAYPQTDSYVVRSLRSRLAAEVDGGRLPQAALSVLPASSDVAPDGPAGRSTSQEGLGETNEQRTVVPDDPAGGDSSRIAGETSRVNELKSLRSHTRTELELAKRRLLDAERERKRK